MALEETEWYFDYLTDENLTQRLSRSQLIRIGIRSGDETAWNHGYARLWLDQPPKPAGYWQSVTGTPTLNEAQKRAEQVNSWVEFTPQEKRDAFTSQINAQIFAASGTQLVEDPLAARAVEATSGGASAKRSELEDTADQDLDTFDSTVIPTPLDGGTVIEAKQTTFVDVLDPHAGTPNAIYGLVVWLEVLTETGAEGAEARAHMFGPKDGPGGAVYPFAQDPGNPRLWKAQHGQAFLWENPEQTASMRLYWASGSVAVDNTKTLRYGDRDYSVVRYGLP